MSRLLENSPEYRDAQVARNTFNKNNDYNVSHPDALSDGDEVGKGLLNNQVGSSVDIESKEKMLAKNIYNSNNEYNVSNA